MPDTPSTIVQDWQGILQQTVKNTDVIWNQDAKPEKKLNNNFLQLCSSAEYIILNY